MPAMVEKPTPFGSAQSSTTRHNAADCDTKARRPGRGGRWARETFRPRFGTAMPKEPGPSARMPAARAASPTPSAMHTTMAERVPKAASAWNTGAIGEDRAQITARSGGAVRSVASSTGTICPLKPAAVRLASTWAPIAEAAPMIAIERGWNSNSGRNLPAGAGRMAMAGCYTGNGGFARSRSLGMMAGAQRYRGRRIRQ